MDDLLKILVPILTFVLGSIVTIAIKAAEQQRDVLRSAAREAAKLTKDWYVQIHTLTVAQAPSRFEGAVSTAVYDYVHNRLILPDFLMHLEVLRTKRRAAALVAALQDFLAEVTQVVPPPVANGSVLLLQCVEPSVYPRNDGREGTSLGALDLHVQRVAREAAKLLA